MRLHLGLISNSSDDLADGFSEVEAGTFISYQGARTCQISRLFGSTGGSGFWMTEETARKEKLFSEKNPTKIINGENCVKINRGRNAPSRLIIRDCHLTTDSAEKLKKVDTGLYMTEWKFENGIDRVTAAANPRQLERVPADSKFKFELIYTVENAQQAVEDLQNIAIALAFLEDDALGGHGSRGYGKVQIEGLIYGAFDAKTNENKTPIFDLLPIVSLLEWTTATDQFIKTGNGQALASLLINVGWVERSETQLSSRFWC